MTNKFTSGQANIFTTELKKMKKCDLVNKFPSEAD